MIQIHDLARDSPSPIQHEFLSRFKRHERAIYAFVEGPEDPSYYRNPIRYSLPETWVVRFIICGNKDKVLGAHCSMDWGRFPVHGVLFFVDKDLDDLLMIEVKKAENLYVTPDYSIENQLVGRSMCECLLRDLLGFSAVPEDEMEPVLEKFDRSLVEFHSQMLEVMAVILACRRMNVRGELDGLEMKDLFQISEEGNVVLSNSWNPDCSRAEFVKEQCSFLSAKLDDSMLEDTCRELERCPYPKRYIRGKYELWFLIAFVKVVHANATKHVPSLSRVPKAHDSLGFKNAMRVLGPRGSAPECLRSFLDRNCRRRVSEFPSCENGVMSHQLEI